MREELTALRALRRGNVHAGYSWAAVMDDGELVCSRCVDSEYSTIYRHTYSQVKGGWMCIGLANSGESEQDESCVHCNKTIWSVES